MTDELLKGLYKFCEEKSKNIKLKAEPQVFVELCNALEELKSYRDKPEGWLYTQAEQNGYNKAIDDFVNKLKPKLNEKIKGWTNSDDLIRWCNNSVDEIAEQLKCRCK